MDVDWLQTFVIAAQEENFSRAADRLHLVQSTVTQHIQKLEEQCGCKLFHRIQRHVVLSSAGQRYLKHAQTVLSSYQAAQEDMVRWGQGYQQTLRIGVSPLVATTLLPRWIQGFQHIHGDIEIAVDVMESVDLNEAIMRESCDLALSRMPMSGKGRRTLDCEKLYDDRITLVAPAPGIADEDGGGLGNLDQLTLALLLEQYTLLTHNHPLYWDDLLLSVRQYHPNLRTMRVSQVHVTINFIVERMGISFLPASTVKRDVLRGTIVEVPVEKQKLPQAATYLLTPLVPSQAATMFGEFVRNYMLNRRV